MIQKNYENKAITNDPERTRRNSWLDGRNKNVPHGES
jgi:hypothetical protein